MRKRVLLHGIHFRRKEIILDINSYRAVFCFLFSAFILLPLSNALAETRDFTLTVTEGAIDLNDTKFMVWTYNGMVPGPEIRVREGDTVKIRLRNKSGAKHGLFFHGLHVPPRLALQEEVPVDPDHEYTYEFIAKPAGTHLYHCSWNMAEHLSRGLYGIFIVEAANEPKFDKEFVYILSDWNSKAVKGEGHHEMGHPRTMMDNDITTINDQAVTGDNPIILNVTKGKRVKIRLANIGHLPHTVRYPEGFTLTHEDGYPISEPRKASSITLYPGKRHDIAIAPDRPGKFPFYHSVTFPPSFTERELHQESYDRHNHDDTHKPTKEVAIFVLDVEMDHLSGIEPGEKRQ